MSKCEVCLKEKNRINEYGCYFGEYAGSTQIDSNTRQDKYNVVQEMIPLNICNLCVLKFRLIKLLIGALIFIGSILIYNSPFVSGDKDMQGGIAGVIIGASIYLLITLLTPNSTMGDKLVIKRFKKGLYPSDKSYLQDIHQYYTRRKYAKEKKKNKW